MTLKRLVLVCMFCLLLLLAASLAFGQVPRTISYQGRLSNVSGAALDGTYSITFSLYDVAGGGTALWSETKDVAVVKGLFSTALGSATAFGDTVKFDKQYLVGVKVGSDAELSPRQPLQSAPYALAIPGVTVTANGNVGVGTSSPLEQLSVPNGSVQIGTGCYLGCATWEKFDYSGVSAANYGLGWYGDPEWPGAPVLWTSCWNGIKLITGYTPRLSITRGGDVGIGTTAPSERLNVSGGNIRMDLERYITTTGETFSYNNRTMANYGLGWFGDEEWPGGPVAWLSAWKGIKFFTGCSPRLAITGGGNVGIGTMSPQERLDVAGNVRCVALTLTSSRRFKADVKPISKPIETLAKLQGVSYKWDKEHGGKKDMGFIAEEVAKVLPELVTMEADGKNAKGMDYSHLVALTVEAIKAQQKQIDLLRARNSVLLSRVRRLEARSGGFRSETRGSR